MQKQKLRRVTPLADFCDDLTAKAERGEIDPVLGRNDEIRMMIDVLMSSPKK